MPTATIIKTDTPRTSNEGSYAVHKVPPAETGSRYAEKRSTPEGHPAKPGEAVSQAWMILAQARVEQAAPLVEQPKEVRLFFVSRDQDGNVVTTSRGSVKRIPELQVARSGKFTRAPKESTGGAILDRYLLEPDYDLRDEDVWKALALAVSELEDAGGEQLRQINDAICLTLLAKAGIRVADRFELPSPGAKH